MTCRAHFFDYFVFENQWIHNVYDIYVVQVAAQFHPRIQMLDKSCEELNVFSSSKQIKATQAVRSTE